MKKIFFFFFFLLPHIMFSQNMLHYLSSTTGAACQAIKYYNDYVFTGTGSTLRAYYVGTGHITPYAQVFEYRYVSQIIRMTIRDNFLYVAANYDGMTKWDISIPSNPVRVFDILPDTGSMSTQAIALKGDTIFLAQFHKISAYKDLGNSFYKINDICNAPLFGTINGLAVKDNLLAYTVTQLGGQNGVYIRDLNANTPLSFYQVGGFLMENVIWGKNNKLLHVMAGTNTVEGYFFTLDASNPSMPIKIFEDTIEGAPYGLAMALPYNAENHNDTIYVANWGGLRPNDLTACFIRAYDATDTSSVHLINYLPAGLWHFDMTINYPKMYVASEWYGIKTVDISDMMNPVDEGNTITGGWNVSSDVWGNFLAIANEGYGFKLYDISIPENPVLIGVKNDPGFCFNACFSHDGQYIYTTNMTYQGMRIYRRDSLIQTGHIQQAVSNGQFLVNQNRIFSKLDNMLNIIDVSNPYAPLVCTTYVMSINDMAVVDNKLIVSGNDSISIYDISGNNFNLVALEVFAAGQDGSVIGVFNNHIYIYVKNKGLVHYELQNNGGNYNLYEDQVFTLPQGEPTFMAADSFALYSVYRLKGLYAYDKFTMNELGYYRTGLDYRKYTTMYGVQKLFCKNGLVFLVEYFSQTSILTGNPDYAGINTLWDNACDIIIFPNPAQNDINIKTYFPNNRKNITLTVYTLDGKMLMHRGLSDAVETQINTSLWRKGIYFFVFSYEKNIVNIEKIIIN